MSHHFHTALTKNDIFPRVLLASISQQMSQNVYISQEKGTISLLEPLPQIPINFSFTFPWATDLCVPHLFHSLFPLPPAEFAYDSDTLFPIASIPKGQSSILHNP